MKVRFRIHDEESLNVLRQAVRAQIGVTASDHWCASRENKRAHVDRLIHLGVLADALSRAVVIEDPETEA